MGETVTFPTRGGTGQGYLARPARPDTTAPGIVVLHEWWASDPQVRGVADRLAAEGFVALVPDLYHGLHAPEPGPAGLLVMGLALDAAATDVAAAADYLAGRAGGPGRVGALGFRMGGSLALWAATRSEEIVATVGWYPVLPWERMAAKWDGYRGSAAMVHLPGSGGPDPAATEQVGQAVEAAGGTFEARHYPDAADGFFNDDHPDRYDVRASALAWAHTLELFRDRLA